MLHLTPTQYPKLVRKTIFIIKIVGNEIIFRFTENHCRIFYGKRMLLIIKNVTIYARYYVRETFSGGIEHYLVSEVPLSTNISLFKNQEVDILETFVVDDDSQALTYQDVRERLKNEQEYAKFDINKIDSYGVPGLLEGFEASKIKELNYDYKITKNIVINNFFSNPIITVELQENKLNYFKLFLYNKIQGGTQSNFINLEFCVDGFADYYYVKSNSHFSQTYNLSNEILKYTESSSVNNYELKLKKIIYQDKRCYLSINIRLIENNITQTLIGYFACNKPQDLWENISGLKSETTLKLNGEDTILINSSLLFADIYGEQKTFTLGDTPTKAIPLGIKDGLPSTTPVNPIYISNLPIGFYRTNSVEATLDGPCNINDTFNSSGKNQISKNDWNSADIIVFNQKQAMYITNTGEVFIGKKIGVNKYEWHRLSVWGHKHSTNDLDDSDSDKKFVTPEQIKSWEETAKNVDKSSWINLDYPLEGDDETKNKNKYLARLGAIKLFPNLVGNSYAGNDMLFANLGTGKEYIPLSIGALTVENVATKNNWTVGTLIKQSTINELGNLGMGVRVLETTITQYPGQTYREQYVLIDNKISAYRHDTNKPRKFFDLVKRPTANNETYEIGTSSINIGFDNSVAKQNSVLYGVGLLNNTTYQTILGNWNQGTTLQNNIKFIIGVGTSSTNRKNAIWYRESNGGDYLHINGKLRLEYTDVNGEKFPDGYVLINGEDPVINDFAHIQDISKLNKRIDDLTAVEITTTKYEDLVDGKLSYTYEQDKPLDNLPLKVILKGVDKNNVFDNTKYAIFLTDSETDPIASEFNVEVLNEYRNSVYVLYVKAIYKNYLTILNITNKNNYTGTKFKLSAFYDFDNASYTVEINLATATVNNSTIFNVVDSNVFKPLEIAY